MISIVSICCFLLFLELLIRFCSFDKINYLEARGIKGDVPLPLEDDYSKKEYPVFYYRHNKKISVKGIKEIKNIPDQDSIIWGILLDPGYIKSTEGKYRICVLGDSVSCFNWGKFNDLVVSKCGIDASVLPFVWGGLDLPQLYNIFKFEILPLKPKVVIYNYYQNDTNQHRFAEKNGRLFVYYSYSKTPYVFTMPYNQFLLTHSKLYGFINRRIAGYLQKNIRGYAPRYFYPGYDLAYRCLADIILLCRENNIILVIVNFPDIKKDFPTDNFIKQITKDFNLEYFDIRTKFIALGYNNDENFTKIRERPDCDAHYNDRGRSLVQDLIFDYLIEHKILPTKTESFQRANTESVNN
ncbi:MAG: hypothetical protein PHF11_03135 [Candidatus Omnitrophica bacterium]|nr:hypothetical protein [Candidatus Omnitrophota bacterium]